jgi:hypothetical protein
MDSPVNVRNHTRVDSAFRAIDNYFQSIHLLRALEFLTIDAIVTNCKQLIAVSRYLSGDMTPGIQDHAREEEEHLRNKVINRKISDKLKEYIDSKF